MTSKEEIIPCWRRKQPGGGGTHLSKERKAFSTAGGQRGKERADVSKEGGTIKKLA